MHDDPLTEMDTKTRLKHNTELLKKVRAQNEALAKKLSEERPLTDLPPPTSPPKR